MILADKLPLKYLLKSTSIDILYVTLFTILTIVLHQYITFPNIHISLPAFLGTAISLILSFRLAQSYDRWWEGRIIWGAIVNDSRTLVLQLLGFTSTTDREEVERMSKRHIAWVESVALKLRQQDIGKNLDTYLSMQERDKVQKARHIPLAINKLQTYSLQKLTLNSYERMQIDSTFVRLVGSMGQAERIKNTVFPTEYQRYLHLSIYLFLGLISISLSNLGYQWEILLLILIATPFFMLEQAAKHLQDPFENRPTDVPISSISRNIAINILELIEADDIPEPLEPCEYYMN